MLSLIISWKRSLLLLALAITRREAIAFVVQSAFLPSTSSPTTTTSSPYSSSVLSSSSSSSSSSVNDDKDTKAKAAAATAPLSKLVDLSDTYQLQPTVADTLPLEEGQRLVCLGDCHGDAKALEDFLTIGGVMDPSSGDWTGGNTILVQCGDVLDRGDEELKCFEMLAKLSRQATKQGGHVILLWGNHEALNAQGLFHYTNGEEEYEETLGPRIDKQLNSDRWRYQYSGNQPARWAAYEPGSGVLIDPLLANMKVAVKVGRTVCVHAGLTSKHLDQFGGIKGMNDLAQQYIQKVYHGDNNNFGKYGSMEELVFKVNSRAQVIASQLPEVLGGGANPDDSPVWMRAYSAPNDAAPKNPKAQQMIDAALFHCQGDRLIMGHTVQKKINGALNGKAWRIDVGASRGVMSGIPEVLEVSMENGKEVLSILTQTEKIPGSARLVGVPQPDPMDMPAAKVDNPYVVSKKQPVEASNGKTNVQNATHHVETIDVSTLEHQQLNSTVADHQQFNSTVADMMERATNPAVLATAMSAAGEIASQVLNST